MARYFLDRRIHIGSTSAPGGFCFPDFGEDRPEPLRALCTIVVDAVLDDQAPGARAISIVDEAGLELAVVPFYGVPPAAAKRRTA